MRKRRNDAVPRNGDIVVSRETAALIQWTIRQVPDTARFGSSSRDEALRAARCFAQAHCVDVWCSDDGRLWLLDRHRPRSIVQLPEKSCPRR